MAPLKIGGDIARADGPGKVVRPWLLENCQWIYRVAANPGMPRGGVLPPAPVLAPGRRSGRVPALPYPPPRLLQCIRDHGHLTIAGWVTCSQDGAEEFAWDCAPGPGGCTRIPAHRRIVAVVRGSMYGVFRLSCSYGFAKRRIVRDRIAVI
jgi:hypothetical protein